MMGKLLLLRANPSVDELGDEGLAAACATGDRAAQSLLFERHADAVYRFVARMRGTDAASADDLVQATFVAAFKSAGSFRGPKLRSWLFGIAVNVVRSHVRREVSRKRVDNLVDPPEQVFVDDERPDLVKLRAAVAALPAELRAVISLVDLEGETGGAAAAALRIPEGTLWRRLARARAALRAAMEGR